MYCYKCGHKCEDGVLVCPECGTVLENKEKEIKDIPTIPEDKTVVYIILSIVSLFFCNQIAGIISLILSILASSDYNKGDYKSAEEKWRISKITLLIGLGLMIGTLLLVFAIWGAAVFGMFAAIF